MKKVYNYKKEIILILTERCNLHCSYCYEHEKHGAVMAFETAKSILDRELADIDCYTGAVIELFGGEAFLNFSLIEKIDEYLDKNYPGKDIILENTTNGTLIHGNVQKWLTDRKEKVDITLSLDGTEEMQNRNRPFVSGKGSYQSIDRSFFTETWSGCHAKMTVSKETLPMLAEGVRHIEEQGFQCLASFALGIDWKEENNREVLKEQLMELIDYYTEHDTCQVCQLLDYNLTLIFKPIDENYKYCEVGTAIKCYDTLGRDYPCQGFAPASLGEAAEQFRDFDFRKFSLSEGNPCRSCKWIRLCRCCYAANYQATGDMERQSSEMCYFNRLCILAASRIQYNRLMKRGAPFLPEEKTVLRAVWEIQSEIMQEGQGIHDL